MRKSILFEGGTPNMGGIYENVVIQELVSCGYDVYYYNSKKLGELDFVIENGISVVSIEVKSGKDYYVHSAINNVLKVEDFGIGEAIVFTGFDLSVKGNVVYYPIYMAGIMHENNDDSVLDPIVF